MHLNLNARVVRPINDSRATNLFLTLRYLQLVLVPAKPFTAPTGVVPVYISTHMFQKNESKVLRSKSLDTGWSFLFNQFDYFQAQK